MLYRVQGRVGADGSFNVQVTRKVQQQVAGVCKRHDPVEFQAGVQRVEASVAGAGRLGIRLE